MCVWCVHSCFIAIQTNLIKYTSHAPSLLIPLTLTFSLFGFPFLEAPKYYEDNLLFSKQVGPSCILYETVMMKTCSLHCSRYYSILYRRLFSNRPLYFQFLPFFFIVLVIHPCILQVLAPYTNDDYSQKSVYHLGVQNFFYLIFSLISSTHNHDVQLQMIIRSKGLL